MSPNRPRVSVAISIHVCPFCKEEATIYFEGGTIPMVHEEYTYTCNGCDRMISFRPRAGEVSIEGPAPIPAEACIAKRAT